VIDHQQGFAPPTVTRPSRQQCDNPTWSHTAFLSRFHARCRSPFSLHNWRSRLLGGSPVESLQSHMILTMSHWSSGLTCLLPATRITGSNPLGGTYVKPGFSCKRCLATLVTPQTQYPSRQRAPPKRLDLWPLLLPAEARARGEPCGHLPTSLVGGQTSGCIPPTPDNTCTVPVYKLICNCK
jgi:hypothetical protein